MNQLKKIQSMTLICFLLMTAMTPLWANTTDKEIKLGKDSAVEIEKQYKVVNDKDTTQHLQSIVDKIKPVTLEPKIQYQVKIIEDKDPNAISLPGGPIYVTNSLLAFAQSDDELAAILAHEMTHISRHHALKLIAKESKLDAGIMWGLLATILTGTAKNNVSETGDILAISQFVKIAETNGYGQELETEADLTGIDYLIKAGYNPVAMLTVMERYAVDDSRRPSVDMGYLKDHPDSAARVQSIESKLKALKIDISQRPIDASDQAKSVLTQKGTNQIAEVVMNGQALFQPAPDADGKPNKARADEAANQINQAMISNVQLFEIKSINTEKGAAVIIRGKQALEITKADLADPSLSAKQAADDVAARIRRALWMETVNRTY